MANKGETTVRWCPTNHSPALAPPRLDSVCNLLRAGWKEKNAYSVCAANEASTYI